MTRVRVALGLVSLAVVGVVAVLAWRAFTGLEMERAVRHEIVAERAFDEMERALSAVLQREEERAFEDYAFYRPGTAERSPLGRPLEPFVVGAFQVDPAGRVTTPLEPVDPARARARGDWPPSPEVHAAIARVRSAVGALWPADGEGVLADARKDEAPEAFLLPAQAPGTTRALSGPGVGDREARARDAERDVASVEEEARTVVDALQAFNRAGDQRAERRQKVASVPRAVLEAQESGDAEPPEAAPAPPPAPAATRLRALGYAADEAGPGRPAAPEAGASSRGATEDTAPRRAEAGADAFSEAEAAADAFSEAGAAADASSSPEADTDAPRGPDPAARNPVRIALDPMVGRAAGADTLVLYRTVLVGQRGWRQGLVIDRPALAAWLEAEVIGPSGLGRVARLTTAGPPARADTGDAYLFAHRFAEPFDAVTGHLALEALPGVGRPWAFWGLVAVLLGVGAAGLLAVHRTAAVAVHYAERRGNFVAAVTHELKTPLTAIRMYAEMLRDGLVPGEEKRREYYGTITDESERLSRLVDNVLEFSRLEQGRRELEESAGPVGPVLEEAAEKLRAHAEREGFALEVAVEPGLPAVRFDRDALVQVLFNLVDNATKYARAAADRRVVLEASREGDAVVVAVRDFGPGVSRGHLEHVFEPFYRGEAERTRTARGTGIGLALVKDLAERMGASVAGANAPDGGFRVRLRFPAARASA